MQEVPGTSVRIRTYVRIGAQQPSWADDDHDDALSHQLTSLLLWNPTWSVVAQQTVATGCSRKQEQKIRINRRKRSNKQVPYAIHIPGKELFISCYLVLTHCSLLTPLNTPIFPKAKGAGRHTERKRWLWKVIIIEVFPCLDASLGVCTMPGTYTRSFRFASLMLTYVYGL